MGLDSVELVLAIEESFAIELPDGEVTEVVTVGQLHELVMSKIDMRDPAGCLTSMAFYRLRRGIAEVVGVERKTIRPDTPLAKLFPTASRRGWQELEKSMNLKLPHQTIGWPTAVGVVIGAAGGALGLRQFSPELDSGYYWGAGVLGGIVVPAIYQRLMGPRLVAEFPSELVTVGDAARRVLALNEAHFMERARGIRREDVWQGLCQIMQEQTGVDPNMVRPESRILRDLGIG